MGRYVDLSDLFGLHHSSNIQSVQAMKSYDEFSRERVSMLISISREGISQTSALPWDSDAEELIGAFVKMLWVAEYPPSWFPEILRDLAENIEIELGRNQEKPTPDEADS